MPKKQSASGRHQDLDKMKEEYKKDGIRIFTRIEINPHMHTVYTLYSQINPQPKNELEEEILRWSVKKVTNVEFEIMDISRRDESPRSRMAYAFVAETQNKNNCKDIKKKIIRVRDSYISKIEELRNKIRIAESTSKTEEPSSIIGVLSN